MPDNKEEENLTKTSKNSKNKNGEVMNYSISCYFSSCGVITQGKKLNSNYVVMITFSVMLLCNEIDQYPHMFKFLLIMALN